MLSRCAVYVDVGYLLASAATRVTGTSLRSGVEVDHARLIESLTTQVEQHSGLPLLRVNWYDSGVRGSGSPSPEQDQIGMLPRVKLRLGRLSHSGEQKGVDLKIGLDLIMHARNGAVEVMYLVSGDDDLTEAVEQVQGHGIPVILLAVPNIEGRPHAVSRHLRREADGIETIDPATIDALVTPGRTLTREPDPVPSHTLPAAVVPTAASVAVPRPTPAILASRRHPPGPSHDTSHDISHDFTPPPPRSGERELVYSSTTGQESIGGLADGVVPDAQLIDEVCGQVIAAWMQRATPEDAESLRAGQPFIPGDIDRALLHDLSAQLGVYYVDERHRHLLRERFWARLAATTSARGG